MDDLAVFQGKKNSLADSQIIFPFRVNCKVVRCVCYCIVKDIAGLNRVSHVKYKENLKFNILSAPNQSSGKNYSRFKKLILVDHSLWDLFKLH